MPLSGKKPPQGGFSFTQISKMQTILLSAVFATTALFAPGRMIEVKMPQVETRGIIIEQSGYVRATTGLVEPVQAFKSAGVDQKLREWVLNKVSEAGFDTVLADKIVNCESGWNVGARHWNPPTPTRPGSWDIGLFQINDVHGMSIEDRLDPYKNTEMAIELLKSKRSWNHWVCKGIVL